MSSICMFILYVFPEIGTTRMNLRLKKAFHSQPSNRFVLNMLPSSLPRLRLEKQLSITWRHSLLYTLKKRSLTENSLLFSKSIIPAFPILIRQFTTKGNLNWGKGRLEGKKRALPCHRSCRGNDLKWFLFHSQRRSLPIHGFFRMPVVVVLLGEAALFNKPELKEWAFMYSSKRRVRVSIEVL